MQEFKKSDYLYTRLFCEENIWLLAKRLIDNGIKKQDIKVIFISNSKKQIAIFNQLAVAHKQAVIWDYHVILMVRIDSSSYIFDFDSRLCFPSNITDYIHNSLPENINSSYLSQFRVIPAAYYIQHFYSDRSHMKNIIPEQEFPDYLAFLPSTMEKIHLLDLINVEKEIKNTMIFKNTKQFIGWTIKLK